MKLDLHSKKFYTLLVFLLVLISITVVFAVRRSAAPTVLNNVASSNGAFQDPKQAAYYRRSAAAFRKQAEIETAEKRKKCYNDWADYYECKAVQLETGSNKQCAVPTCNPQD